MKTIYKKKLLEEIDSIPEKHFKAVYNLLHLFNNELKLNVDKKSSATLFGIWKGSNISDDLIKNAKKSVFSYER